MKKNQGFPHSPIRYPGGKGGVVMRLWKHFPKHFTEYREPFLGSGSVLLSVPRSVRRWGNDICAGLMNVFTQLRDHPTEFTTMCRAVKTLNQGNTSVRMGSVFATCLATLGMGLAMDDSFRWFYLNRVAYNGMVERVNRRPSFTNPEGWNLVTGNRLEEVSEQLQGVELTTGDYRDVLPPPGKDGGSVFIYCDPPYEKDSNLANTSKLYRNGMDDGGREELLGLLEACGHKCMVSLGDDEESRRIFKNWNLYTDSWTYNNTSSWGTSSKTKKTGKELILTNY